MIRFLRLSLRTNGRNRNELDVIICLCRGKSERDIANAIDNGATALRDLQRCGIGDQCGSCHHSLRAMLAQAAAAASAPQPCPAHPPRVPAEVVSATA